MNKQAIAKVLDKVSQQPTEYSIGFRRLTVLPVRVRRNINLACVLKGETNNNSMIDHFNRLTESEYENWLKTA